MCRMAEHAQTQDDTNGFSGTRSRARERFLAAVETAGGHSTTLTNPRSRGPAGEAVTLETGWIGPPDARNVLMSISGTHGLEAFAGSAAQIGLARRLGDSPLPAGTAVLLVHGYNGHGWAHSSRANESNVDLNRNMIDFAAPRPQNALYDRAVHDLFAPRRLSGDVVGQMRDGIRELSARHGYDAVMDAINRGQYTRADGVYHGGSQLEWSSATLLSLISRQLAGARCVACIDWHTGMGSFGEPFFICFHDPRHAKFQDAARFWGRERLLDESGYADAPRPSYQGLVINAVERAIEAQGARMIGAVVEFGTYEPDRVEAGIMIDRALRFGGASLPESRAAALREAMQETFNPDSRRWRESVAAHSRAIFDSTLEGLAE